MADEVGAYPEITYGAEVPERITQTWDSGIKLSRRICGMFDCDELEKQMKKIFKEGCKRGVEIEAAASFIYGSLGGWQFFCTTMDEPAGDVDLLYESMRALNFTSQPAEEERWSGMGDWGIGGGGSGRIGKIIISKDQADSKLALVAYVPPAKHSELKADQWMTDLLKELGGGDMVFGDAYTAKGEIKNDPEKNLFVLKLKDSAVSLSINYLKGKGLFPDKTDEEEPAAEGYPADAAAAAPVADDDGGEPYPDISYGCEVPEKLTTEKMEKKMKKIVKEGGKRGVEIEGAADMGGLQFFCTTMDEPQGDADLLYESMRAMNFKSDPTEEERKGGSGRIGKMLISKDQADTKIALVAYVPVTKHSELKADQWMTDIIKELGGGEMTFGDAYTAKAEIKNDPDKNLFVMKLKDSAITLSYNYLKTKGLFPDKTDDSDDEFVFGDDDFPSM